MIRVADYFVNFMTERGVKAAFMVAGGQMMHLIDAVGRCQSIRYFCNHHEQASAFAADAYARMTGLPGLCYATGGPGGTNLLTGIVGAYQDSIPIIFFTGQCKTTDAMWQSGISGLRQKGTFEVDIVSIVRSVTKYAEVVTDASTARLHMERAWHLATSGRPGPVLLDVPLDVQGALIDPENLQGYRLFPDDPRDLRDDAGRVAGKLMNAQRPLILAGHGVRCSGAVKAFRRLVARLNVPVITTQLAKDLLPHNHPLFIGHPGIKGDLAANLAVQNADVILILGSSLHFQNTGWEQEKFAPQAHKIHVDPDRAVMAKTYRYMNRQVLADVGRFIDAMLDADYAQSPEQDRGPHEPGPAPADLYEAMDVLSDALPDNAVILTDAGQPYYIVPQGLRLKEGQRYLAPGSLAEMGWALPAAIGAAVADPSRMVVAIIGDGSLQTNIQELQTIRHHNLNVKVLVVNNGGYASIRSTQDRFFDGFHVGSSPESGVSLPNLSDIANAYKIPISDAISVSIQKEGPAICELFCRPTDFYRKETL